ncbi:hypothetical protein HRbin36_00928 [bacterium HR36]|uniref:Hypothetical conserved protein n=1 Tax=uncultured Planctomycetota bacterium TaxID=120965 RepID=H5SC14_9BACT|nr:hypothetical conserved protein [uncultured Planctomycetota bacterium]GBD35813.1 hypothetical protein HRbin36_00928 [bacterium HR36]
MRGKVRVSQLVCGVMLIGTGLLLVPRLTAQNAYPHPRLQVVFPPGGKVGTTVEVTLTGTDLDDPRALVFSHAGLKAELIPPPPPDPKKPAPPGPPRFRVQIPADVPPGMYDVCVVGRFGVSNPRTFCVGELEEVVEQEPNNDVDQAQKVPLNVIINGVINPNVDVDYYAFEGKKGQRVVVVCQAFSIDSRLDPQVQIFSSEGRQLAINRRYRDREAVADTVLPADGVYYVRLVEFTHQTGGPEHVYRLTISTLPWIDAIYPPVVERGKPANVTLYGRNLPGSQVENVPGWGGPILERLSVTLTPPSDPNSTQRLEYSGTLIAADSVLDGFTYRLRAPQGHSNPVLVGISDQPVIPEQESNDSLEKPQEIAVPCELAGRVDRPGDHDWFAFTAKQGEVFWLEGYAERLGSPMDLYLEVYRIDPKDNKPQLVLEGDDIAESLHVFRYFTRSSDPRIRFAVPQDGRYLLHVRSREADLFGSPRHIYRISIHREQPDFRLFALCADETLPNQTLTGGLTLHQGGARGILVLCERRDGFAGEVSVAAENLPAGVTCAPQVVGPNQRFTYLVLEAAADARISESVIRIRGTANLGGQTVSREARAATVIYPVQAAVPPYARLARQLVLAVREKPPFALQPAVRQIEVPPGGPIVFKVKAAQLQPDFKAAVQITPLSFLLLANQQPNAQPQPIANVNANAEAEVRLQVPPQATPGTYNLVLQGRSQVPFSRDPKGANRQNVVVTQEAPPIKVVVYGTVAELALEPGTLSAKPNDKVPVTVRIKRLHNYTGPLNVQLVLPPGVQGLAAQPVQIPANVNEAKLILQIAGNLKPGMTLPAIVRATANLPNNVNLNHEAKLEVKIAQ